MRIYGTTGVSNNYLLYSDHHIKDVVLRLLTSFLQMTAYYFAEQDWQIWK